MNRKIYEIMLTDFELDIITNCLRVASNDENDYPVLLAESLENIKKEGKEIPTTSG